MSCDVISLFPTPLYISKIGKVTEGELQHVANLDYEVMHSKNGEYSKDKYVLERSEFSRLKDEIDTHVGIYCHDVLKISRNIYFKMTNSWVVKHNPGDWAQVHIHTNCLVSGVTYLQVSENSGEIEFHCDVNNFFFPSTISFTISLSVVICSSCSNSSTALIILFSFNFPSDISFITSSSLTDDIYYQ
jgi:uncharacterized protein (TIGR02466 family)